MKKHVAAVVAVLCPGIVVGLVGGYEVGRLPFWGLLILCAGCIYAEWWALTTLETIGE